MLSVFFISCSDVKDKNNSTQFRQKAHKYAQLFSVQKYENMQKLSVLDVKGQEKDQIYLLKHNVPIPDSLSGKKIIRVPVQKVVCLSTTHIAFLDALGESQALKAVSGSKYIYNPALRARIDKGDLPDVGYESSLDFELLIRIKPDIVFIYNINGAVSPAVNKLKQYNIPLVQINEYLESSVLGQAEWIKFFAPFFEKERIAETVFSQTEKKYLQLKKIADTLTNKPKILVNMPWKGTWYIPGGKSNMAQLIKDAGGDYIWKDTEEQHTHALNIEDVYLKARNADIWINPGQANSIESLIASDKRLKQFKPVSIKQIFNRNKRLNEYGGNDYMESGVVRPDIILNDLMQIFHSTDVSQDSLYYYTKLF